MIKKHKNRWPEKERESAKNIGGLIKITILPFGVQGKVATYHVKNTKIDDSTKTQDTPTRPRRLYIGSVKNITNNERKQEIQNIGLKSLVKVIRYAFDWHAVTNSKLIANNNDTP